MKAMPRNEPLWDPLPKLLLVNKISHSADFPSPKQDVVHLKQKGNSPKLSLPKQASQTWKWATGLITSARDENLGLPATVTTIYGLSCRNRSQNLVPTNNSHACHRVQTLQRCIFWRKRDPQMPVSVFLQRNRNARLRRFRPAPASSRGAAAAPPHAAPPAATGRAHLPCSRGAPTGEGGVESKAPTLGRRLFSLTGIFPPNPSQRNTRTTARAQP